MTDGETAGPRDGETGRPPAAGEPSSATASEAAQAAAGAGDTQSRSPAVSPSPASVIALGDVLAWLDARESPAPPELRERMAAALAAVKAETIPGALAEAALACLQETVARPQERGSALDLLAADALLTYALEAAAELGAETLRRIAAEYGPATLDRAVPEEG